MPNNIVDLRKQAEKAVEDMPEGSLKTTAFQTILTHLLSAQGLPEGVSNKGKSPDKRSVQSAASGKGAAKTTTTPASFADRVLLLKTEGFFSIQRSIAEIRNELKKFGWHYPVTSMSGPLQAMVQRRELRREHVHDDNGRKGWRYSNS